MGVSGQSLAGIRFCMAQFHADDWLARRRARIGLRSIARLLGAGAFTFSAVIAVPLVVLSVMSLPFWLVLPGGVLLFLYAALWLAVAVAATHALIYFLVLPLVALLGPTGYWGQQILILVVAASAGFHFPLDQALFAQDAAGSFQGAIAGAGASAPFGLCVRGMWDATQIDHSSSRTTPRLDTRAPWSY